MKRLHAISLYLLCQVISDCSSTSTKKVDKDVSRYTESCKYKKAFMRKGKLIACFSLTEYRYNFNKKVYKTVINGKCNPDD